MKLTFHGGAKSVTGANYLLESGDTKILIDCGLQQGGKYCEHSNFESFPYDPKTITAVCITHAHIDHTGRLPMLYTHAFRGEIYSTPPTKDFTEQLLLDSEHILANEAKECGMAPPYSSPDIIDLMSMWRKIPYHRSFRIGNFEIEFYDAGHILGSASIRISAEGKTIVFSGDLGNSPAPFINPTEHIAVADYALIESAYGERTHEDISLRQGKLENIIEETVAGGGTLMIPAFALERTQALLFELNELVENGRIPHVPIFLDSPLAIRLTAIYQKYSRDPQCFNKDAISLIRGGDAIFDFPGLHITLTSTQSRRIAKTAGAKIIIAGAGMSNGGRILHHEKRYLSGPKNTILFIGYQVRGSRGRDILDGAKSVSIHGEEIPIQCRIEEVSGYSAHADQPQLLQWLEQMRGTVKKVFVVQGEESASSVLAQKARDDLAINALVPSAGDTVEL